jgi:hypothetical protein
MISIDTFVGRAICVLAAVIYWKDTDGLRTSLKSIFTTSNQMYDFCNLSDTERKKEI